MPMVTSKANTVTKIVKAMTLSYNTLLVQNKDSSLKTKKNWRKVYPKPLLTQLRCKSPEILMKWRKPMEFTLNNQKSTRRLGYKADLTSMVSPITICLAVKSPTKMEMFKALIPFQMSMVNQFWLNTMQDHPLVLSLKTWPRSKPEPIRN